MVDLPQLPDYLGLTGDEDTGVTLECRHPAHDYGWEGFPVVCLGGTPPKDVSTAADLNGFLADVFTHAAMHTEQDAKRQRLDELARRQHRRRFYIVPYWAATDRAPAGEGTWTLAPLDGSGEPDLTKQRQWTGNITDLMDGKVTSDLLALDRVRYAIIP